MDNGFIAKYAVLSICFLVGGSALLYRSLPGSLHPRKPTIALNWAVPDVKLLSQSPANDLIRYGHDLIVNTSSYLGPHGSVAAISNGMNCGNCHLDGGTRFNANAYFLVSTSYPKFRKRSGMIETIQYRVNDCMQRSLNGASLDTSGKEMSAIVAYINWIGNDTSLLGTVKSSGVTQIPFLSRSARADLGAIVYSSNCESCHGHDGDGKLLPGTDRNLYPALWGKHSYNVSAGMYRLSQLASFIKYNMPYKTAGGEPTLSDEQAWDVAAYINSRERDRKRFADWPILKNKPFDFPFGPYADTYTETQHKFGPWTGMISN